jgi:hypothetical protein
MTQNVRKNRLISNVTKMAELPQPPRCLVPTGGVQGNKTFAQSALHEPGRQLNTRNIPDCRRVPHHLAPLVQIECGPTDTSENVKGWQKVKTELEPRCPRDPGRKADRRDGSVVDRACSHMLVSKIKPCIS